MKLSLENIKDEYKEGRYKEALSVIARIEQDRLLYPEVLVWKGRCLQLIETAPFAKLSYIENAFKQALEIDQDFAPAILELGWFYLNVLDDPERAKDLFEKAIRLQKQMMTESVIGMAKCMLETTTKDIVKSYLETAMCHSLDSNQIQQVVDEIEASGK